MLFWQDLNTLHVRLDNIAAVVLLTHTVAMLGDHSEHGNLTNADVQLISPTVAPETAVFQLPSFQRSVATCGNLPAIGASDQHHTLTFLSLLLM